MTPFDIWASWIIFGVCITFLATMGIVIYRIKPTKPDDSDKGDDPGKS